MKVYESESAPASEESIDGESIENAGEFPEFVPHVTHDEYPELTFRSIVLSCILSVVLGSANVYLGLLVGMTISASIPASVISMSILKFFKNSNILENNIVQTGASSGEALAAGCLFTIPGLVIMNVRRDQGDPTFAGVQGWDSFLGMNYFYVSFLAFFGGILGIMWSIPIRRALLLEIKPALCFPEGVATAEVLKSGQRNGKSIFSVICGALIGMFTKLFESMNLYKTKLGFGFFINASPVYYSMTVSASLIGVGYIIGPYIGAVLMMGSVLQWWVVVPVSSKINDRWYESDWNVTAQGPYTAEAAANSEFGESKYIGVGLMIIGGIWALVSLRQALYKSITFGVSQFKRAAKRTTSKVGDGHVVQSRTDKDIPFHITMGVAALVVVALYFIFASFSDQWGWCVILAILVTVLSFLFSSIAAYMAGLVGSSNNPISGTTICSALAISGLVLAMFGKDDPLGPPTVVILSCAVACSSAIGGDNLQDLKSGYLLGATPWKQEVIMVAGVAAASFTIAPILELLHVAYVIGVGLEAPQASIIAAIPVGIINGTLPWVYIGVGIGLGAVIIAIDCVLARFDCKFRLPVLAFAVSMYLPSSYISTIFLGSLIPLFFAPAGGLGHASEGVLSAAGLITGEALVGILTAIPIAVAGKSSVLHVVDTPELWPCVFPLVIILVFQAYSSKYQPFTRTPE
mmetsp:Transcript_16375/g.28396  ORF Transcript_16375/g.28396 Transcript_16375/m.28396 type:complete len:691 (-) Transcript_16375:2757-4829(-)